jgi:hypothetical protein
MLDDSNKVQPGSMVGSVAASLHEGSRSEYLAQYIFSGFGTAVPVPRQEDSGLDIYCTLLERRGQRAWPVAYYSVQVKSTMAPWVFNGAESVRWLIEHPLPIFLCVVEKAEARILVYHTSPRFAAWILPTLPQRLELIPGTDTKAQTVGWDKGDRFQLNAPILNFTVQQVLDRSFRAHVAEVLKFWIEYDIQNLVRIRVGIPFFWAHADYETNTTKYKGWTKQGGRFRDDVLPRAERSVKELLGSLASHCHQKNDLVSAAIYATVLRHLSPAGYSDSDASGPGQLHDAQLHTALNKKFNAPPGDYLYRASDSLLKLVKDELGRHGITEPLPPTRP